MTDRRTLAAELRELDRYRRARTTGRLADGLDPDLHDRVHAEIAKLIDHPDIRRVMGRVMEARDEEVAAALDAMRWWVGRTDFPEDVAAVLSGVGSPKAR